MFFVKLQKDFEKCANSKCKHISTIQKLKTLRNKHYRNVIKTCKNKHKNKSQYGQCVRKGINDNISDFGKIRNNFDKCTAKKCSKEKKKLANLIEKEFGNVAKKLVEKVKQKNKQ